MAQVTVDGTSNGASLPLKTRLKALVDAAGDSISSQIKARLRSWRDNPDFKLQDRLHQFELARIRGARSATSKANASRLRSDVAQALWGEGFVTPGGREHLLELIAPLGLKEAMTVLEIGAGLGGCGRLMAKEFGALVIGLEPDADLAAAGAALSECAGLGKQSEVRRAPINPPILPARRYDRIFAKEAFCRAANRHALLEATTRALRPGGQILFTDYLLELAAVEDEHVLVEWFRQERMGALPWTLTDYDCVLRELGLELRDREDLTEQHRGQVLRAWSDFRNKVRDLDSRDESAPAVLAEGELWRRRVALIDAGALKVYRFHAELPYERFAAEETP